MTGIVIPDGGTIGSASDTDAISIASNGNVTASKDLTITGKTTLSGDFVPATPLSHRNLIINGDFQVWQRATSATNYNVFATADRWRHLTAGQVEKTTDSSTNRNHVLKFTTSDSQTVNYIREKVEAPANYMGNTLTLSFWMKTSEVLTTRVDFWLSDSSSNYAIYGFHNGSSTGSGNTWLALAEDTSTSWKRHTVQVYIPNYTPKTDGNDALEVNIGVADGTATGREVYIDQVQLELGSVATPFERRSYADELARCQRYYWKITGNIFEQFALYRRHNTSNHVFPIHLPVPMRHHTPTIYQDNLGRWSSPTGSWSTSYSGVNFYATIDSPQNFTLAPFQMYGSGGEDAGIMAFQNNGYLALEAEL